MFIDHIKKQQNLFIENINYSKKQKEFFLNKFKFIDLFAGSGGFRVGFTNKNSECVFSSEWDKDACKTYHENFKHQPFGDINKLNIKDLPDFHILLGGFHQPFSKMRVKTGIQTQNSGNLFFNIVEM